MLKVMLLAALTHLTTLLHIRIIIMTQAAIQQVMGRTNFGVLVAVMLLKKVMHIICAVKEQLIQTVLVHGIKLVEIVKKI